MKLGEITLNGKQVSVFAPPHNEPDLPWVDVEELAKAYFAKRLSKKIVAMTHQFGGDVRSYSTAKNGDRIATIVPHALAQGLCGAMDHWNGHPKQDGPIFNEYVFNMAHFAMDKAPMNLEAMLHAYHNPGGKYLRGVKL